jgi:pimeloyl-ACP methyl ester carboxylesterase
MHRYLAAAVLCANLSGAGMTHHTASVNGQSLHYVSSGQGSLILFLHGFPEFWYAWKNQLEEFGKTNRAVALDMRGYNLSSKPEELDAYRMPHLVADVKALAEHLGVKKFTLVGHDWGGVVAWSFAAAHPEMLDRLIIVNAPHPTIFGREIATNPAQQKASQYMLLFRSPEGEAALSKDNYAWLTRALSFLADNEEDRKQYVAAWSQPGALAGGLNYYRASRIGPPGKDAPATAPAPLMVKVPTLVIWGERDTALLTGNLDGLDKVVPELTVKRIPDGSHWVIHEKPEMVNGYIREFLKR